MNYPLYTPWKQIPIQNKTPLPRNCDWCGKRLFLEDRIYHKGNYYHKHCFDEKLRLKSEKYRRARMKRR